MKRHDLGQSPTELLWRHLFAKLDFITVLHRLINCSTPKTASYNYSLKKLLWNVKFYLNQYFSQTSSHEIVRRNVKLTREILNLDSKIKHLRAVYKKDINTLGQSIKKTSKSCADDSKVSLVWVKKRTEHDLTLSPNLFFWAFPTWCRRQNIFPMYISIKRHSWFFKSWWCLLYFGHVQMRTAGKCWRQKTPFCLKLSSNAQKSVLSWSISIEV